MKEAKKSQKEKKDIIAYRKSCLTNGTGLTHFILLDKKGKK